MSLQGRARVAWAKAREIALRFVAPTRIATGPARVKWGGMMRDGGEAGASGTRGDLPAWLVALLVEAGAHADAVNLLAMDRDAFHIPVGMEVSRP